MENSSNTPKQLPSAVELLTRQYNDWVAFHKQLVETKAPSDQLGYAYDQMVRLDNEIKNLNSTSGQ